MARPRRLLIDGHPHLVHLKGISERSVFGEDQDYKQYLLWLDEGVQKLGCILHAYLLLPQQIYLLLEPLDGKDISRLMQGLGRLYVRYINMKERRTGTLWDGRFRSSPLQRDPWLKNTIHYLMYKPVSDGLCSEPENYSWSSYQKNALHKTDFLLTVKGTPDPLISAQIELAISRNRALGSSSFT